MTKKSKGFNTPFEKLADLALPEKVEAAKKGPAKAAAPARLPSSPASRLPSSPASPVAPPPPPLADPAPPREEELFEDEMRGVAALPADPRGRVFGGAPTVAAPPRRRPDDDAEAYAELADLVEGVGPFDITATDEYIEGLGPGIDKRLLRKLRAGDYSIQAHLDLHGLTSEAAHVAVEKFLIVARQDSRRCVLIIHGRGHGSKEGIPVLKERLKVWLTRGRIGRGVLAFCTARPADGGAGAVYVLLRR